MIAGWRSFPWGAICQACFCFVFCLSQAEAEQAENPPPAIEAQGGAVYLSPSNTLPLTPGDRKLARVGFPPASALVLGEKKSDPAHQMLRRLVAAGQAAGNAGDLYENRDRGHSPLAAKAHPQLTHVLYDDVFRRQGLDYGLGLTMLFDAPLIGNSSTAVNSGKHWRSLPRLALTTPGGAELAFAIFTADIAHRATIPRAQRERPEGSRSWNNRSRRLQRTLIERWGTLGGS